MTSSRRRPTWSSAPTAVSPAATTPASSAQPRARSRPTCSPARTTRSSRSARRPRATSASAATRSTPRSPASATHRRTPTRRRSASTSSSCSPRARSTGSSSSTRASSAPASRRSSSVRSCRSAHRPSQGGDGKLATADGTGPAADFEFEPDPSHDPRDAAAALHRGPHLRRAAQRSRQRARLPPAGDEERDRQRRGAHQEPQPRS